jgi:hypothetical protein
MLCHAKYIDVFANHVSAQAFDGLLAVAATRHAETPVPTQVVLISHPALPTATAKPPDSIAISALVHQNLPTAVQPSCSAHTLDSTHHVTIQNQHLHSCSFQVSACSEVVRVHALSGSNLAIGDAFTAHQSAFGCSHYVISQEHLWQDM